MLRKVLIANRGEIACRIIRTARAMGLATVAVYSDADATAMHVEMADEAIRIGPGPATESYLGIERIVAAAGETGADCVHPGYGFLAENAEFAEACAAAGVKFIGPSPAAMRALGGKSQAKNIAIAAGVPVVPGYQGDAQDLATLQEQAGVVGYPVMIKAVAGGGGRGMRLVEAPGDFATALEGAQREAQSSFGDARVLIEKFIARPRHIEVQVFGDSHGDVVHMFERDCTLQRRNQKVVEEAPAPGMSAELRQKMTSAAVAVAKSVGYEGAGTVEFLVDGASLDGDAHWYFIEMNTRLQVEHPVTEEITGLDLVEWQFRVAGGEALPLRQDEISYEGHAVELRLCAEDPANGFAPSVGAIIEFDVLEDGGLRIESGVRPGSSITPFYDSMIAKVIRSGTDRALVIDDLMSDLENIDVLGLKTNLPFLHALLAQDDVQSAKLWTGLIGERLTQLVDDTPSLVAVADGARALLAQSAESWGDYLPYAIDPWDRSDGFQLGGRRRVTRKILADGREHDVTLTWHGDGIAFAVDGTEVGRLAGSIATGELDFGRESEAPLTVVEGETAHVLHDMKYFGVSLLRYDASTIDEGDAADVLRAPINGRVSKIFVAPGARVSEGDSVAVVEAMKMEHVLSSPRAGTLADIRVEEGAQVNQGEVIASLEAEEAA